MNNKFYEIKKSDIIKHIKKGNNNMTLNDMIAREGFSYKFLENAADSTYKGSIRLGKTYLKLIEKCGTTEVDDLTEILIKMSSWMNCNIYKEYKDEYVIVPYEGPGFTKTVKRYLTCLAQHKERDKTVGYAQWLVYSFIMPLSDDMGSEHKLPFDFLEIESFEDFKTKIENLES